MTNDLPRKIRVARDQAGLTQVALAERLGVEQSAVSRWESGASAPSVWRLQRIARETDKPISFFLEEETV